PPRADAVPARRFLPVVARHDGEIPRPRSFAADRRMGALRRADAGRHAVRMAPRRRRLLANAASAAATPAFVVPAGGDDLLLRRTALSSACRSIVDNVSGADLRCHVVASGARRAADATTHRG